MNRISLFKKARVLLRRNLLVPDPEEIKNSPRHLKRVQSFIFRRDACAQQTLHDRYIIECCERKVTLVAQHGKGAQINLVNIRDKSVPREETGRE